MKEKSKFNLWLVSIFIILVFFVIYLININKDDFTNGNTDNKESYNLVKNYNNFYTVNSCIYRYLTILQSNNASSLIKVLDGDFIKSNNINESNVYNYLTMYDGNVNFNSRKMYEEKINDNITKYYVYGYVEKDVMDSFPVRNDAYFIVKLDNENSVFTIMPYSGNIFK